MNQKSIAVLLACIVCAYVPGIASAHDEGVSYEETVGAYTVDVGYSSENPVAGERLVFDFDILDAQQKTAPYERVWVRLSTDGQALLATSVARQELGPTTLLYSVPETLRGDIEVFARFESSGGEEMAEVTFPLTIASSPFVKESNSSPLVPFGAGVLGLLVGGAVGMWIVRRKPMIQ